MSVFRKLCLKAYEHGGREREQQKRGGKGRIDEKRHALNPPEKREELAERCDSLSTGNSCPGAPVSEK